MPCRKPVLILEGPGDAEAIPFLIRRVAQAHDVFDLSPAPRPKTGVEIRRLLSFGQLERYVEYALREDGDSVLIVLDCDDHDPAEVLGEFQDRIAALEPRKRVECALFRREFEALFLHCALEIVAAYPEYGWREPLPHWQDPESVRGAKGALSECMSHDRAYKPTRDQARFVSALSLDLLRAESPSFQRFERVLLEMAVDRRAILTP